MNFKMKEELEEILEHTGPTLDILEYKVDEDRYGNIYGTNPPSINQIVNTINNIVLKVGELDYKISQIVKYLKHD